MSGGTDSVNALKATGEETRSAGDMNMKWQGERRWLKVKFSRIQVAKAIPGGRLGSGLCLTHFEECVLSTIHPHLLYGLPIANNSNIRTDEN
mgnify:CR=1 FL=1